MNYANFSFLSIFLAHKNVVTSRIFVHLQHKKLSVKNDNK
jgi:hypothetical protein